MKNKETKKFEKAKTMIVDAKCNDSKCHIHGSLKSRGRTFEGKVIKKFPKRLTIEFERIIHIRKYERYKKAKTKIHARLPDCMYQDIKVGDYVQIQECRPLSKIIHFTTIKKTKDAEEK